jgi:hypothetical protein
MKFTKISFITALFLWLCLMLPLWLEADSSGLKPGTTGCQSREGLSPGHDDTMLMFVGEDLEVRGWF